MRRPGLFRRACVGRRMSWVAKRTTSRPEAKSTVCLAFSMPKGARECLPQVAGTQEQILASSDDESIFAWEPVAGMDFVDASENTTTLPFAVASLPSVERWYGFRTL